MDEDDFRPLSGNLLSLHAKCNFQTVLHIFVPYRGIYFLYSDPDSLWWRDRKLFSSPIGESTFSTHTTVHELRRSTMIFVPYRGIYFLYPASRTPLFIRVPELFCGAKFKNCFSFSISYACAAFSLILCGAAQNSFYCRENSILPIPISYNFPWYFVHLHTCGATPRPTSFACLCCAYTLGCKVFRFIWSITRTAFLPNIGYKTVFVGNPQPPPSQTIPFSFVPRWNRI